MPYYVVVLGTAGSGKTTVSKNLKDYLLDHGLDAAVINMDPAVEYLPYEPDVDVRDYVNVSDLIERLGLGPNGALIAATDMLALKIYELREEIDALKSNYIIIDTPGQLELFAFRRSGPLVVSSIVGDGKAVNLFLMDAVANREPRNVLSSLLLATSVNVRMRYPQVNVVTKIDLLSQDELEEINSWFEDPDKLAADVAKEGGYIVWDSPDIEYIVEKLHSYDVVFLSNVDGRGFDELYASIQRVLAGGEDYLTEEPNPRL